MAVTADVKFTIDPIASTLTSTPPTKASTSTLSTVAIDSSSSTATVSPISSGTINITSIPGNVLADVTINPDEFTTNVRRELGVDDNFVVLGDGLLDKLMETATEHLAVQYENGRIRGEDYATAYIHIYQATLQAATTVWLQKGVREKELALQLATTNAQNKLQADTSSAQLKVQADIAYMQSKLQADTSNAQLKLQADTSSAQFKLQADTSNAQLALEADKLKNQGDLQWAIALLQRDSQEALTEAQTDSERAKKELYRRQIEGFDEDYKQKILKILMDSWAVGFSVARDSFEAAGIPAPMQKVTIDSLYNQFVVTEFDKYTYGRPVTDMP